MNRTQNISLLITCEHGGNRIPAAYRPLFAGHEAVLQTHRGYDIGALEFARLLSRSLAAPLVATITSRLLIELNRSPRNRFLFSEFSRNADRQTRRRIYEEFYLPYREQVRDLIRRAARGHFVLHLSSHSFTPELDGEIRNGDVCLLYDPKRAHEADFCKAWQNRIGLLAPNLKLRRNYPYRGDTDGLTTAMRAEFASDVYAGIEIEINQRHPLQGRPHWPRMQRMLLKSLQETLAAWRPKRA